METTAAFRGLVCTDCGASFDAADAGRCPDCGGVLDPTYDYDAVDLSRADVASRPADGLWRYEELLPLPREAAVTTGEGATPAVDCPKLADELGVERVLVKDEGRNPTGTATDRGAALAVTAAARSGATDVALSTTGGAGQAVAAYAGRADLDAHVFVPTRAPFGTKAMVNVHGGDMTVVEGRFDDADAAATDALDEHDDWRSLRPFDTPYRHEGRKTAYYELVESLDWAAPDHVVCPTGHGVGLAGLAKGAREWRELGLADGTPALHAAQAAGCAPVVRAWEDDADGVEPWEVPDTICGGVEVPDPAGGSLALDALREFGGRAVAAEDGEILDAAVTVARHEGVEMGVSAAAAAAGAWSLAQDGAFGADDTVVLLNTAAGNREADVLRSHLMGMGV